MLDQDQIKELLLAVEENQILDDLFNHPGMRILLQKANDMHDNYNKIDSINTMEQLSFRRGQIDVLRWFLNFHPMVKGTLVTLVEDVERNTKIDNTKPISL